MRRKDDRRKLEREKRRERKKEERQRKEQELRRLKNLKREEIQRRLGAISEMSGGGGIGSLEEKEAGELVEGDFDPDKWDSVSKKAFNDKYYHAADADDSWKPGDDPLAGLGDLDQYEGGGGESWGASEEEGGHGEGEGEWEAVEGEEGYHDDRGFEEGEGEGEGAFEEEKMRLLDELYKLDYEDIIGDIPCRFKYTQVKADDFGLAPEEILLADDKFVPLKKLAPYRTDQTRLDAQRRRKLREEILTAQEEAEAEMEKIRSRKKRRGKKGKGKGKAPPGQEDGAGGGGGKGQGGNDMGVAEAAQEMAQELAGGKRRRRKKGQKKKRAREGGGAEGEEALVPRSVAVVEGGGDEEEGEGREDPAVEREGEGSGSLGSANGHHETGEEGGEAEGGAKVGKKRRRKSKGGGESGTAAGEGEKGEGGGAGMRLGEVKEAPLLGNGKAEKAVQKQGDRSRGDLKGKGTRKGKGNVKVKVKDKVLGGVKVSASRLASYGIN
ncbi:unnamed protein product [Discosporangium mesarthrocarpum]